MLCPIIYYVYYIYQEVLPFLIDDLIIWDQLENIKDAPFEVIWYRSLSSSKSDLPFKKSFEMIVIFCRYIKEKVA